MDQRVEAREGRLKALRFTWRWAPLLLVLAYVELNVTPDPRAPWLSDRDGAQHFVYALNLAESGTFSLARRPAEITPDAIRTPVYPALMALVLKVQGVPPYDDVRRFMWRKGSLRSIHGPLLRMNHLIFMALIAATYIVALRVTGSGLLALLSSSLAVAVLAPSAFQYRSEVVTALVLLVHAEGLRRIAASEAPRLRVAIVCGLAGGVLVLTTPSFIAWLYIVIASVPALYLIGRTGRPVPSLRSVFLVAALMMMVVGSWMTRNLVQVGQFTVSGRGGAVMAARAEYDAMSWADYRSAWKLWPDPIYTKYFIDEKSEWAKAWRLNRRKRGSYYERSRHLFLPLYFPTLAERSAGRLSKSRSLNHDQSAVAAQLEPGAVLDDAALRRAALAAMRENWVMHLALIPPLALRGAGIQAPLLLGILIVLTWRRSLSMTVFFAPALVSVGFHAALTHFIPRYASPLLPLTAVAAAWALAEVVAAVRSRLRARSRPELA